MAALNTRDAEKRATAMEVFIAWYPTSVLRTDAYEQAMAAWHAANQPAKADDHRRQAAAGRSRQRARARQPHLRRAGARHPGRSGGDGVDGRGGAARPRRAGQMAQARDARRRRLRAHQAAAGRGVQRRAGRRCVAGQGLRQGPAPLSRGRGGRARQSPGRLSAGRGATRGYAARCVGLLVCRALHCDRARRQERGGRRRHRPLRPLALSHLSRQRAGLERTAGACRRGRARAARGLRQVDPARADAARSRPAGRRRARSRFAVLRRLGACPQPSRRLAGEQGGGGQGVEGDHRQAAGRRHAAQDSR